MATFRRSLTPGGTYFFTVNTYRRQRLLTDPRIYAALKMAIQRVKESHPFDIEAFVLLPDHLHCVWRLPAGDMNYAMRWSSIKRQVSQAVRDRLAEGVSASRTKRRELGLWQRRFWEHQIRDDDDFMRHVEYIHFNPVKHGYVQRVRDWPYSSFMRMCGEGWVLSIGPDVSMMAGYTANCLATIDRARGARYAGCRSRGGRAQQ